MATFPSVDYWALITWIEFNRIWRGGSFWIGVGLRDQALQPTGSIFLGDPENQSERRMAYDFNFETVVSLPIRVNTII